MTTKPDSIRGKSIFISRKTSDTSPFNLLSKEQDIVLIDEPLIRITQIPFSHTPQTKWIFFSSKNAIKYFFSQNRELAAGTKLAVISRSSGAYLSTLGKQADFTGEGVDLNVIAKEFRDVLQNDSVLFPQAMDSLQTIQKHLSFTNTTYNLYTYKTSTRNDFEIPYTDVVIFTSPSNVIAYFSKYKITDRQLVIAMGSTTKYKLSDYGIKNVITPASFDEEGLFEAMINAFN